MNLCEGTVCVVVHRKAPQTALLRDLLFHVGDEEVVCLSNTH